MAETYAQRKAAVLAALRRVRQSYRKSDSAGEILERELDRLLLRKTIITPASLQAVAQKYDQYMSLASGVEKPLADTLTLAANYT
jgi:hypothetical protein